MMKKYNKPEIVALALETVDVIETSGDQQALEYLQKNENLTATQKISGQISKMDNKWSW